MSEQRREIPTDVGERLAILKHLFRRWVIVHYTVSITGLFFAVTVAARPSFLTKPATILELFAWFSALCVGLLGFLIPARKAKVYKVAWKRLEHACARFAYDESFDAKRLHDGVRRVEDDIDRSDAFF